MKNFSSGGEGEDSGGEVEDSGGEGKDSGGEGGDIGELQGWAIILIGSVIIIFGCCVKLCISVIQSLVETGQSNSSKAIRIYKKHNKDLETVQITAGDSNKEKENNIPTAPPPLEYLENIEDENQKLVQNQNSDNKINNLETQAKNLENQAKTLENQAENLEYQAKNLEKERFCKICIQAEICYAFIPCGHQVTCENCVTELKDCPICRKKITNSLKIYLS